MMLSGEIGFPRVFLENRSPLTLEWLQRFRMPCAMVTFNGRITLPNQVRQQLGLKTGDNVDFVEVEKGRFRNLLPRTHRP